MHKTPIHDADGHELSEAELVKAFSSGLDKGSWHWRITIKGADGSILDQEEWDDLPLSNVMEHTAFSGLLDNARGNFVIQIEDLSESRETRSDKQPENRE